MKRWKGKWILITGASSGIGEEFAKQLAKAGCNLIITARRVARLKALSAELKLLGAPEVEFIGNDLSTPSGASQLYEQATQLNHPISVLINNAGIGRLERFHKVPLDEQMATVQLNINALTELTHRFLNDMLSNKEGWILQVASVLSYASCPNYAVYAATKAYVLSFSEAVRQEVKKQGIVVSVLCPGPTKTEFAAEAKIKSPDFTDSMMMGVEPVVQYGLKGLLAEKSVIFPGEMTRFMAYSQKLVPKPLLMRVTDQMVTR